MVKMEWKEDYSVNIKEIDFQHKKLIDLINELGNAMSEGKGKEVVGKIITELRNYTLTHFRTEEKLFEKHNYPQRVKHKAEHDKFVDEVKKFQKGYEEGKLLLTMDVMNFLQKWLINHILGEDKKYVGKLA